MAAGLGTMLTGFFPSFVPIIFTSMLMSFGFHYFEALNNSLAIQHFDLKQTPIVMGRLRGLVAGGSLMISVFVFLFSEKLSFVWLFFVPGAVGLVLGFFGLVHPLTGSRPPKQRKRMLPQKRYWLFYVLNLLMGGRRIVFSVFAVFLMVEQFGFSVRSVSLMFMFNYAVNWMFNPMVGKIINRLGERRLMTIEYFRPSSFSSATPTRRTNTSSCCCTCSTASPSTFPLRCAPSSRRSPSPKMQRPTWP